MSAELKKEKHRFIFPEDLQFLKQSKNTPDIEAAIKNVEALQRMQEFDQLFQTDMRSIRKLIDSLSGFDRKKAK